MPGYKFHATSGVRQFNVTATIKQELPEGTFLREILRQRDRETKRETITENTSRYTPEDEN